MKKHGKQAKVIRYSQGGGHELFFNVGYYWGDVRAFLREKLAAEGSNGPRETGVEGEGKSPRVETR
ncbi:MAG: hypothetical protein HYY46_18605 [Deltaproteobacteria bacterium]|nr:hypothetical protein [Deltaproteobacteria bacterium]